MAVGDAYVFPGFLTPVLTLLFFQSHRLLFSHASAEVRGENTPERKVASTWDWTHNHQVLSPTRSPLSHPGRSRKSWKQAFSLFYKIYLKAFFSKGTSYRGLFGEVFTLSKEKREFYKPTTPTDLFISKFKRVWQINWLH